MNPVILTFKRVAFGRRKPPPSHHQRHASALLSEGAAFGKAHVLPTSEGLQWCTRPLLLLQPIGQRVPRRAIIFVRQKLAGHADCDAVALGVGLARDVHVEVDCRHDAVAEFLLDQRLERRAVDHDQLVEAVDQRVGRRHRRAGAAERHFVGEGLLALAQASEIRTGRETALPKWLKILGLKIRTLGREYRTVEKDALREDFGRRIPLGRVQSSCD